MSSDLSEFGSTVQLKSCMAHSILSTYSLKKLCKPIECNKRGNVRKRIDHFKSGSSSNMLCAIVL